ncbi:MAG: hypothetical protein B6U72_06180 [Candidatus Altiarchaeales archaeon ex4484_2]|nr:MAG: hypothetical protein B6U72_06180 [Candidatus Altiarchaeales archaeon ex4484_2]
MDRNKTAIIVLTLAVAVLATLLINKQTPCEQKQNDCPPSVFNQSSELKLIYLEPINCVNCDIEMIEQISRQLGVPIEEYVSDSVPQPSMLIFHQGRNTLATADRRYNILDSICQFTNQSKACELRDYVNLTGIHDCLKKHNITKNTTIFFYKSEIKECQKMKEWIQELDDEHSFYIISLNNADRMGVAGECLPKLVTLEKLFVPQLICPANGRKKIGSVTKEELKKFAANCYST